MRLAVAVSLLVLTASSVVAQEDWQAELRSAIEFQLDEWNLGYEADGLPYRLLPAELADSGESGPFLYEAVGESKPWKPVVQLEPGKEYVIMAVCDRDCYDIDLYASSGDGDTIDEDTEDDAVPVVEFTADGAVMLQVEMIECGADFCYAAVGVFEKVE